MLKPNLVSQIYDIIKERIVTLQLKLGEKIDIQKLAEEFGTSPTPIREALNKLAESGLVNIKPRVGYYVTNLSIEEIVEIYDLRKMFESNALESAIRNIKPEQLDSLKQRMKEFLAEPDAKKEKTKYDEMDKELHLLIIKNSNNKKLQVLFLQIYDLVRISLSMGNKSWEKAFEQHMSLIDALQEKNLQKATKILNQHIDDVKADAIRSFKSGAYSHSKRQAYCSQHPNYKGSKLS